MCPRGVRYCSPSVCPDLLELGGIGLVEVERDQPVEVADRRRIARSVDRYVNTNGGPDGAVQGVRRPVDAEQAELGQRPSLGGEERNEQGVVGMFPASTMRQLAQIPFVCGRQLHRQVSRIRHGPTSRCVGERQRAVDADLERQHGPADDALHGVEEHFVAARRARQSLHILGSLADDRGRMLR